MRKCYIILFVLTAALINPVVSQNKHINTDTVGTKSLSDNLYNTRLFADSLCSSFVIVVKKEVKAHKHLYHSEHVIVLDGKGKMKLGDEYLELKKGDMVFIPKNTPHSVISTGKTPLKVISIQAPYFDGKDRIFID